MNKLLWVLFGNDEDGIYGTDIWRNGAPKIWLTAIQWWIRNPFHNLFWHVLNWPSQDAEIWPTEDKITKFRLKPPLFSFRKNPIEGYIGFRSTQGVFGIALRRTK